MGHVHPQRIGETTVPKFFTKTETEADLSRFVGAETGRREVLLVSDGVAETAPSGYASAHLFTLTDSYLVGANQLMVFARSGYATGGSQSLPQGFTMLIPRVEELATMAGYDANTTADDLQTTILHYEETSANTIRVYNLSTAFGNQSAITDLLCLIPHTATPALSQERVTIRDQGDNQAVVLEGRGDGVLFTSPSGARFLVRANDNGNLVVERR